MGALQTVLARRVAVAAWRLQRADRIEIELFAERGWDDGSPGLALIRDGNGTRSFETLLRYRGAAMAEFWRALRTLKALQAEQAEQAAGATHVLKAPPPLVPTPVVPRPAPNEPGRRLSSDCGEREGRSALGCERQQGRLNGRVVVSPPSGSSP